MAVTPRTITITNPRLVIPGSGARQPQPVTLQPRPARGPERGRASAWGALTVFGLLLMLAAGMFGPGMISQVTGRQTNVTAHADPMDGEMLGARALVYHPGYSVQGRWLCYGWASGAFHCTTRWYRSASGAIVSINPGWVPNLGRAALAAAANTRSTSALRTVTAALNPHTNGYAWGQCTYGAALLAHDNVSGLGNAYQWAFNARAHGLPTGYTPRVGATVVFQRGVDGASWLYGHVGHVVAVYGDGSFRIEAMNDVAGFGRFGFRTVWMNPGVSFIY